MTDESKNMVGLVMVFWLALKKRWVITPPNRNKQGIGVGSTRNQIAAWNQVRYRFGLVLCLAEMAVGLRVYIYLWHLSPSYLWFAFTLHRNNFGAKVHFESWGHETRWDTELTFKGKENQN